MSSIEVLSIDGGGIRGIIPAVILGEMQQRLGRGLHEVFDFIVGTSTGGIIRAGDWDVHPAGGGTDLTLSLQLGVGRPLEGNPE